MHYSYKAMRDFAARLSREFGLRLEVTRSGSKKSCRYTLSEWHDIQGSEQVKITLGIYDKEQKWLNRNDHILRNGECRTLNDALEKSPTEIREARIKRNPIIWVEMSVCKTYCTFREQVVGVVSHYGLLDERTFEAMKRWLDTIRGERVANPIYAERPHLLETLNIVNSRGYDLLEYKGGEGEFIFVGRGGKCGTIDLNGKPLCELKYDNLLTTYKSDYIVAINEGKIGMITYRGDVVIPFEYDHIGNFKNGLALFSIDNKWGVISDKNEIIIPAKYDNISDDCDYENGEELLVVEQSGKYGCVTLNDEVKIPLVYDYLGAFARGLAPVKIGDKWGYINEKGEIAIECQFDYAFRLSNDFACVILNGEYISIDKSGKRIEKNRPF